MTRVVFAAFASVAIAACAVGCRDGSYGNVRVTAKGGDPSAILDLPSSIRLNEGAAASAQVNLYAKDGDLLPSGLQVVDPTVLQIAVIATDQNGGYVFLGVQAGETTVNLVVRGQVVASVPVVVTAPPAFTVQDAGVVVAPVDAGADAKGDAGVDAAASDASFDGASSD